jgi:uncharacterized membrane protein
MTRAFPANSWKRQRGAIGLLGAVTLLLAVLFAALVVDSGRLWMQKRHLQTVADIASIQAARQLGCGVVLANVVQAAQNAAVANGYTGNLANSPNIVDIVNVSTVGGIRQFTTGGTTAVRVYATREVPSSLVAGGLFGGTVVLNAQAVSRADPAIAAFSAGSFAASIDTEDSVLLNAVFGDILGSSVDLDLVSYEGIAAADITLNDLLQASGQVGGLDSLLNTSMSLGSMFSLFATAMSNSGTANAAAIAGMQELASAAVGGTNLTLADVLSVATPDEEAAGKVGLNALSLITTTALIANGSNALSVPLSVSVPGVTSITGQINVIEPPQMAIGPAANDGGTICTTVSTAQVEAEVDVVVTIPLLAKIDMSLQAQVGQGSAGLSTISNDDGQTSVTIQASPGIASLDMTNAAGTGPARITTLLNLPIASIALDLPVQSASAQAVVFDVDHPIADHLPQTQTVSSPIGDSLEDALDDAGAVDVTVLSVLNTVLVNTVVSSIVTPLLGEIGRVFLDPLLEMLGIRVGGMDVTLEGLQMRQEDPLII